MTGSNAKIATLHKTELFRDLTSEALETLAAHSSERRLAPGEVLFVEGAPANHLFVIVSGSLRAFRTGPDGREQTVHVEPAGSTIAEIPVFDGGLYPSTVAAEAPTTVLSLARDRVLALCAEHPAVAIAALRVLAFRLRRCAALVEALSLSEVGQRVAQFLLEEVAASGDSAGSAKITLHLSQEKIASRVGSVREVVSRTMSRLQQEELITIQGRHITIPDLDRLSSYANSSRPTMQKPKN